MERWKVKVGERVQSERNKFRKSDYQVEKEKQREKISIEITAKTRM